MESKFGGGFPVPQLNSNSADTPEQMQQGSRPEPAFTQFAREHSFLLAPVVDSWNRIFGATAGDPAPVGNKIECVLT